MDTKDSILIVDDDPEIRRLLVDYLAKNGFDPVAARRTALKRAGGRPARRGRDVAARSPIIITSLP